MHLRANELYSELHESIGQFADTWEKIVFDYGAGAVWNQNGLARRWADSDFRLFNSITLVEPVLKEDALSQRLLAGRDYMDRRTRPGYFWLFEELLTAELRHRLPALADEAGLAVAETAYGMASNWIPKEPPSHPTLTFVRVASEQHLLAYADINSAAYGLPSESGRDGISRSTLLRDEAFAYLALQDGVPVSTAAAIETNDRLVIALVATKPGLQRRGFAEATVRKALYEGHRATGLTRSVLHASEGARPLYERLGYHCTSTIRLLSRKL